jgi:type IV pilus assembly protein PilA
MSDLIRKRLTGKEEGFTLIELLVVIVILGILMAIAVPSYLGFQSRAYDAAAKANVRAALPSVEAYYGDNSTYATMTAANLALIDAGIKIDPLVAADQTATSFCISSTQGSTHVFSQNGPAASITAGKCPGAP